MSEFRQFIYSNTGTEITFMEGLIDILEDLGLTCEDANGNPTTAAAQYADRTSASQATFYFNLGHDTRLCLQRYYTNNEGISSFLFNGAETGIFNAWWRIAIDDIETRECAVKYIKTDDILILWLGDFSGNYTAACMQLHIGNEVYVYNGTNTNPISQPVTDGVLSASASPLFQYAAEAGKIDYVDHTPFISSGIKQFDCPGIFSCSTIPQYSSIALPNGKNYYAIGTNFMVEV